MYPRSLIRDPIVGKFGLIGPLLVDAVLLAFLNTQSNGLNKVSRVIFLFSSSQKHVFAAKPSGCPPVSIDSVHQLGLQIEE